MQYSVPQFIDVEDKIIGPLTLKQFLVLLAGGLFAFFYWSLFKMSAMFFLLLLPTMAIFAALAFGKFNGRPFLANMVELARYFFTPKFRIFHRESGAGPIYTKKTEGSPSATGALPAAGEEERASRLKRLAYLLDQKGAEEERLIHSGGMAKQWLDRV